MSTYLEDIASMHKNSWDPDAKKCNTSGNVVAIVPAIWYASWFSTITHAHTDDWMKWPLIATAVVSTFMLWSLCSVAICMAMHWLTADKPRHH